MTINVTTFAPAYVAWWRQLQPAWRTSVSGMLSQDIPQDEEWVSLAKGGTAGIYTVVVALSWWIRALDTGSDASEVLLMVRDLCWVLQQLHQRLCQSRDTTSSLKRARSEDVDVPSTSRGKRYVPQSLIYVLYSNDL